MTHAKKILNQLHIYEATEILGNTPLTGSFEKIVANIKADSSNYEITDTKKEENIISFSDTNGSYVAFLLLSAEDNSAGNSNIWIIAKNDPYDSSGKDYLIYNHKAKNPQEEWNLASIVASKWTTKKAKENVKTLNNYMKWKAAQARSNRTGAVSEILQLLSGNIDKVKENLKGKNYKIVDQSFLSSQSNSDNQSTIGKSFGKIKDTLSKFAKKAILFTKDEDVYYVACLESEKWQLAIPDMKSDSDYRIYNQGNQSWINANDRIKKQNPNLTNFIRNLNFKNDFKTVIADKTKSAARGIGSVAGTLLAGPLGGYIGGKIGNYLGDKITRGASKSNR